MGPRVARADVQGFRRVVSARGSSHAGWAAAALLAGLCSAQPATVVSVTDDQRGAFLPYDRARMYPVDRDRVWKEVWALFEGGPFGFAVLDEANGVLVTRRAAITNRRYPGFDMPAGVVAAAGELHVFVPRAEPGRVYVGSMMKVEREHAWRAMLFNAGSLERWLFERLGERIGDDGRKVPRDFLKRLELAESLAPGSVPARCRTPAAPDEEVTAPVLIKATQVKPLYPDMSRYGPRNSTVVLVGVIQEDGALWGLGEVANSAGDPELTISAGHTASFWRYLPALRDGCPVAIPATVTVDYRLR